MILNDNSTQQINTLVIQLQNRITNLSNELKSLNKEINNLDTEISDLKRMDNSQANDTAAMNAEIKANTKAISGKADKGHTHTKSDITDFPTSLKNPNALTVNGKTYDGSSAVNAGVQTVANGGTGVTTQAEINKAFIGNLDIDESDVTDGTEFVSSYASNNGFSEPGYVNTPYKRKFSTVWSYIKGKISSVLGLTKDSYGGKASTAGTADVAKSLVYRGDITNTDTFQVVMNNEGKWHVTDLVPSWIGSLYSFHVGGSQSGLMFRIRGGSADIRNIEVNYSIDSNRFAGPWNPLIGRIPIGAPSSPQDGDIWIER